MSELAISRMDGGRPVGRRQVLVSLTHGRGQAIADHLSGGAGDGLQRIPNGANNGASTI